MNVIDERRKLLEESDVDLLRTLVKQVVEALIGQQSDIRGMAWHLLPHPKKVLLRCFVASEERYSWSGGGRHLLSSCLHLQRTHPCERLLVVGEAPAQRRRVERKVLFFEARRTGLVERAESQQPLVRRGRPIVALADLGAGALLGDQLHRGQEEVHAKGAGRRRWRPPGRAWPGCRSARSRPRGAPRSSSSARRKQESFFSLGRLRVKVIRSSPHQAARCALMNSPPLSQVDAEQREGQAAAHVEQRLEGPPAGAVTHDAHLGPAAGHVGDAERVGELAAAIAALVADQVDLDEAGLSLVPLGEGAHRDLALQQATRLGMAQALEAQAPAFGGQQAVDGRRRHGEQLRARLIRELQLAVTFQSRDGPRHGRCQALAADAAERRPDLAERREQIRAVERGAAAAALAAVSYTHTTLP